MRVGTAILGALLGWLCWSATPAKANYQSRPEPGQQNSWSRFLRITGGQWKALWDHRTNAPIRIYGEGIAAPGTTQSAAKAEQAARTLLSKHLGLLAPGSRTDDFVTVSNLLLDNGMRVVGMQQLHQGRSVVGGQFSVRIVRDRIIVIAAEAFPHVSVAPLDHMLSKTASADLALAQHKGANLLTIGPLVIVPSEVGQTLSYQLARRVELGDGGRSHELYIGAGNGVILRQRPLHEEGSTTIVAKAPVRSWHLGYQNFSLPPTTVTIAGQSQTSGADGSVQFSGDSATASFSLDGPHARVINEGGSNYVQTASLSTGVELVWRANDNEFEDAQLSAFVHVQEAKEFARSIDPNLAWLDEQMNLYVNEDGTCNAYSNHNDLHFYRAGGSCGNTARIPDVVYHEFGHSVYHAIRIEGIGQWTRSYTEGLADFYAVSMTGDPAWGDGFANQNGPWRHCDPLGTEKHWPEDTGNYYEDGIIYCGAMFDLRKSLIAKMGDEAGAIKSNRLFFDSARTLRDIPSSYVELLAADDDDGNLANGTPNGCLIQQAFALHGLADPDYEFEPSVLEPELEGEQVLFRLSIPAACAGQSAWTNLEMHYQVEGLPGRPDFATTGQLEFSVAGDIATARLPRPPWGAVIEYQVVGTNTDGVSKIWPQTEAAPHYQYFVGEVTPLYCSSFEDASATADWTHSASTGHDSWGTGPPSGAAGDPRDAFTGSVAMGTAVGPGDSLGAYAHESSIELMSPEIAVGDYEYVRVQYRRWLSVEDGLYDQASLRVNGEQVWNNSIGDGDQHHFDREWRLHDIDISGVDTVSNTVQVSFALNSDRAKAFGGWNIDKFCIVAYNTPVCGDGEVAGFEECDDGNADEEDDCASTCISTIVDDDEQPAKESGGCGCSSRGSTGGQLGGTLLALVCALLLGRRRRNKLSLRRDLQLRPEQH